VWVLQSGHPGLLPAADLLEGGSGDSDVIKHEDSFQSIPQQQGLAPAAARHGAVSGSSSQSTDEALSPDVPEATELPETLLSFTQLAESVGPPSMMWCMRECGVRVATALEILRGFSRSVSINCTICVE
jgi:hypothetical protein